MLTTRNIIPLIFLVVFMPTQLFANKFMLGPVANYAHESRFETDTLYPNYIQDMPGGGLLFALPVTTNWFWGNSLNYGNSSYYISTFFYETPPVKFIKTPENLGAAILTILTAILYLTNTRFQIGPAIAFIARQNREFGYAGGLVYGFKTGEWEKLTLEFRHNILPLTDRISSKTLSGQTDFTMISLFELGLIRRF